MADSDSATLGAGQAVLIDMLANQEAAVLGKNQSSKFLVLTLQNNLEV